MSTLNVATLQNSGGTGTAATLASINGGPISGARNRIINGAMAISQRGTSFTANGYTLDRWTVYNSGGTFTLTQQTAASGSQPENGMTNFLRIARTSPSGIFYLSQKIEDVSLYDGFTVTVSFYAKANTSITLPVRLVQEFGSGGSTAVTVGTVNTSITTSWAKYTANFTLPSLSGKTIGTSSFLELVFDTPATYSTLDITGVQLEAGTVATPFERRSYGQELALCQRYYYRQTGGGTYSFFGWGKGQTFSNLQVVMPLPVTMRAIPGTIDTSAMGTFFFETGATAGNTPSTVSIDANATNLNSLAINVGKSAAFTVGSIYWFLAYSTSAAYIGASAEL